MVRCKWCEANELLREYHDKEWGIPLHDDRKLFEFLVMEVMQCGLNWNMMMKKREIFRSCFDGFDYDRIAEYGEEEIQAIMDTPGMIRSARKIRAVIHDAGIYKDIREEYGSFDRYLWGFTEGKTLIWKSHQQTPVASNALSDRISRDLKKRGFKYMGSVTIYSHMQACGMINDHDEECGCYGRIIAGYPVEWVKEDTP